MKCFFCERKMNVWSDYEYQGRKIECCWSCANERDLRTFRNSDGFGYLRGYK